LRKSGARVDSSCLEMTLNWEALPSKRSNSVSTSGCGESRQTVSLEAIVFVATVLEGRETQAFGQGPWDQMFTNCY